MFVKLLFQRLRMAGSLSSGSAWLVGRGLLLAVLVVLVVLGMRVVTNKQMHLCTSDSMVNSTTSAGAGQANHPVCLGAGGTMLHQGGIGCLIQLLAVSPSISPTTSLPLPNSPPPPLLSSFPHLLPFTNFLSLPGWPPSHPTKQRDGKAELQHSRRVHRGLHLQVRLLVTSYRPSQQFLSNWAPAWCVLLLSHLSLLETKVAPGCCD